MQLLRAYHCVVYVGNALRIYLCNFATNVTGERTFLALKRLKNERAQRWPMVEWVHCPSSALKMTLWQVCSSYISVMNTPSSVDGHGLFNHRLTVFMLVTSVLLCSTTNLPRYVWVCCFLIFVLHWKLHCTVLAAVWLRSDVTSKLMITKLQVCIGYYNKLWFSRVVSVEWCLI